MHPEIEAVYGNKVRARACGLCWQDNRLLVLDHQHLGEDHFWAPPGGGINFGQSVSETLSKEFEEETGLTIKVKEFLFVAEFIKSPLHAIELFFEVEMTGGQLKVGFDPETKVQILKQASFMNASEIMGLPFNQRHGIFSIIQTPLELRNLRGYVRLL